jgi:hypothetical protein
MSKIFLYILGLFLIFSCNKKKYFDGPNQYVDSFENYKNKDSLIDGEDVRWSFFQLTKPTNSISIDSTMFHTGKQSILFTAEKSDDIISKASTSKQFMAFWEGQTLVSECCYYIEGTDSLNWLFLMDLEEKVAIGAGPGMRLALVNDKIRVEHKYFNPDIIQNQGNPTLFPRNQWVKLRFETLLSKKKKGSVRVYQNDVLIISQDNWKTLPTDFLYFQQGTKGMYNSVEFGITANSKENNTKLHIDDVHVFVK